MASDTTNAPPACATSPRSLDVAHPLAVLHRDLAKTGRGKHIPPFSYYHVALVATVPRALERLVAIPRRLAGAPAPRFNVAKLDGASRVSYLQYQDFRLPFPALTETLACDLRTGTARHIDYSARENPPILHRKELLLPADHPLVPVAERLTRRLEALGAFENARHIGTLLGWRRRLASLGLDPATP